MTPCARGLAFVQSGEDATVDVNSCSDVRDRDTGFGQGVFRAYDGEKPCLRLDEKVVRFAVRVGAARTKSAEAAGDQSGVHGPEIV